MVLSSQSVQNTSCCYPGTSWAIACSWKAQLIPLSDYCVDLLHFILSIACDYNSCTFLSGVLHASASASSFHLICTTALSGHGALPHSCFCWTVACTIMGIIVKGLSPLSMFYSSCFLFWAVPQSFQNSVWEVMLSFGQMSGCCAGVVSRKQATPIQICMHLIVLWLLPACLYQFVVEICFPLCSWT